jgi:two-component system response regulator
MEVRIEHIIKILLAEDNPDDVIIAQRALGTAGVVNQLYIVKDGQEALDFLRKEGKYTGSSVMPGLILLDINLPKVNGLDVLSEIKKDDLLRQIPVVMLTSSQRDEDVVKGYENGCNSYVQKPVEFERFVEVVRQLGLYWGLINLKPVIAS